MGQLVTPVGTAHRKQTPPFDHRGFPMRFVQQNLTRTQFRPNRHCERSAAISLLDGPLSW